MAQRYEVTETVIDSTGRPLSGASCQINDLRGTALTLYTTETGSTTLTNPTTTSSLGRIDGVLTSTGVWTDAPDYDIAVTSGSQSYTQRVRQSPAGEFNVKSYGATGDDSTDDRAACQAAIDAAVARGGGTVYFPPGSYIITGVGLIVPPDVAIRLVGAGRTLHTLDGARFEPTRLKRTGSAGPVLTLAGTGGNDGRSFAQVSHMGIYGDRTAGQIGILQEYGNGDSLDELNFTALAGGGLICKQLYNGDIGTLFFRNCGSGIAEPAMLMTGFASGGCNSVVIGKLFFFANQGTEFVVTSSDGIATSVAIEVGDLHVEQAGGALAVACPSIDLRHAGHVQIANAYVHVSGTSGGTNDRTVTPVRNGFLTTNGTQANQIGNLIVEQGNAGGSAVPYAVDIIRGSLQIGTLNALTAGGSFSSGLIHLAATANGNPFHPPNLVTNTHAAGFKYVHDERTSLTYATAIQSGGTLTLPPGEPLVFVPVNATPVTNITMDAIGTDVDLVFAGITPVITNAAGGSGQVKLNGAANFTPSAGDILPLRCLDAGSGWYQRSPASVNPA